VGKEMGIRTPGRWVKICQKMKRKLSKEKGMIRVYGWLDNLGNFLWTPQ
jgi:hypothetical protein